MIASLGARVKEMRESLGYTQEQIATKLGVGRVTLAQIETGKRKVTPEELQKLGEIFDVSVDMLLGGTRKNEIVIDKKTREKFEHLILYILQKVGAKYNVGKVVLYKLLYFAEFDHYELYKKHISGYPFIKLPMGPAPYSFDTLIDSMKKDGKVVTFSTSYEGKYVQQRFVPNIHVDTNLFTPDQLNLIDRVLDQYSDLSAKDISDLSHEDIPWKVTENMGTIDYKLTTLREYPFSPLARNQKKKEAQGLARTSRFLDDLFSEPDLYEEYR